MKRSARFLVFLVVLGLVAVMAGWAGGGGDKAGSKVGGLVYIIDPSQANPYFKAEVMGAEAKLKELGYTFQTVSHDDDVTKQDQLYEAAIAAKAVGIISDNASATATYASVQKAKDAGIPTFLIGREINQTGIAVAQIVSDNYSGARAAAEEWVKLMGEEGNYVEFLGPEFDNNAEVRSRGYHEVIDQYPGLKLISKQVANWDTAQAYSKMDSIIQTNRNIKGVISGNDTMALGAIQALKAAGIKNAVVMGFDGADEARDAILAGEMSLTTLQTAYGYAQIAVEQLDLYLRTGSTGQPEKQLVPCITITSKNAKQLEGYVFK
ncbi:MAG: D-ribose ABC transporter substrate-binding protein [Treponema sp.]|jgi:erythritol transport system substrate-binding protein|nr:D-ribose ABC transporter substrate-binding protein [Treponema sp.]